MQLTLDRALAEPSRSDGSTGDTVTIDRARLLQLRDQLEVLRVAMDERSD